MDPHPAELKSSQETSLSNWQQEKAVFHVCAPPRAVTQGPASSKNPGCP